MVDRYMYRIQTKGEIEAECFEREADGLDSLAHRELVSLPTAYYVLCAVVILDRENWLPF